MSVSPLKFWKKIISFLICFFFWYCQLVRLWLLNVFLWNSFAGTFSEKVTRTVRQFSPHLAAKMRPPLTYACLPINVLGQYLILLLHWLFYYCQPCHSWTCVSQKSNSHMWPTSLGVCLDVLLWYFIILQCCVCAPRVPLSFMIELI